MTNIIMEHFVILFGKASTQTYAANGHFDNMVHIIRYGDLYSLHIEAIKLIIRLKVDTSRCWHR